ncbi:MAG: nucleotidyltransferase domain-containing protein [Ignavibacteriae bacterium]|nr:MAG: nucleotidyltransferase domain-containing protein [Ignavibacteriota bacterium]
MDNYNSKIQEIINKIVDNYGPDKIILFGSYATGSIHINSDIDLLIIKDSPLPRHRRGSEVRKYLYGTMVPMDIVVYTNKEIEEDKDLKFSFIYNVMKSGKVLYEKIT